MSASVSTDLAAMVQAERRSLATLLDSLTPEQWSAPTVCAKWNINDLVAHLVAGAHVTAPHFLGGLIKSRFSFNTYVERDVALFNEGGPAAVKARFAETVDSKHKTPGPSYVALGEVMVHGEDIRNAVGTTGTYPEEHLVTLAELYKTAGAPLRAKKRIAGLRLQATDAEWATGDGPTVSGPCMALIQAMVGRPAPLASCRGDGVDLLQSRC